ncbi:hypothetical protein RTG_02281 [Rhodotorula toruloides ATCC 204091]|uniref:Endonuclease/exonuclease/phosphatase domain-containing protein n=1 Tax=Rhodotorula toruloides TaxID=5286 RepID=A0A0K3CF83_RHOTO|nr:hypothetical protein RTG_02281 [Rhodotorula toruloides ATCC 204091]
MPPTSLPDGETAPIRNLILLSTRLGPAVATQVAVDSGDVVAVDVELLHGDTIRVVSMYNPCNERGKEVRYLPYNHSVSTILPPLLALTAASSLVVVAGDFNLSHPDWDELVGEPDEAAEEAVRTFIHHDLIHYLPPNTITHHHHNTNYRSKPLDLFLGSLRAKDRVVSCGLANDLESGSDHRPIRLVLALETTTYTPPPRRAFRRTDPTILERTFLDAISRLPTSPLLTPVDIDERAIQLTDALQTAVSAATPFARARAGRVVPWWDKELAEASRTAKNAANRAFRLRGVAGREVEVEFAEEIDEDAPSQPQSTTLPWPELHECEVKSVIMQARPFTACGPDDVPNHVLQLLLPLLLPHLVPLYRASLALGHLPRSWRNTSCIVLRKPKKPDYRNLKAYRLIAFERCIAKGLERIVAARLLHLAENLG